MCAWDGGRVEAPRQAHSGREEGGRVLVWVIVGTEWRLLEKRRLGTTRPDSADQEARQVLISARACRYKRGLPFASELSSPRAPCLPHRGLRAASELPPSGFRAALKLDERARDERSSRGLMRTPSGSLVSRRENPRAIMSSPRTWQFTRAAHVSNRDDVRGRGRGPGSCCRASLHDPAWFDAVDGPFSIVGSLWNTRREAER